MMLNPKALQVIEVWAAMPFKKLKQMKTNCRIYSFDPAVGVGGGH